jgi:MYXO-CTERM domain-containing protein
VRVVYLERPEKTLPYTMAMVSGDWTDTNLSEPAGGVAPGADCGALGQRHVVYAFESASAVQMANTTSQEAGHAYGLDHTFNCESVMSYCGGGDQSFQSGCDGLCESQCQGPNSAGCQLTHEMFCGEGSVAQDDVAEMMWIFGGNEPDMEDPTVEIVEPAEGAMYDAPADVQIRAVVDDNYGGFGWEFVIEQDGEVLVEQVDYEREVDAEYRAALNLSGLPAGSYVLRVRAVDHYDGEGFDEVAIQIGPAATSADGGSADGDGTGDTGADDGDGTGVDDDADDGDGTDDGSDDVMGTGDEGPTDRGCSCRTETASPLAALSIFALVAMRPRRRRRSNGGSR